MNEIDKLDRQARTDIMNMAVTDVKNPKFNKDHCYNNACLLIEKGLHPRYLFTHIADSIEEARWAKLSASMIENSRISAILDTYAEIQKTLLPHTSLSDGSITFFKNSRLDVVAAFVDHHNPHPESNTVQAMRHAGIDREEVKEFAEAYLLKKKIEETLSSKTTKPKKVAKI
ncbi:hypothetical protein WJ968_33010 [Achromobacter xylosoxidans]|uniref:hypothetical protein n=1 Tax=Alcaligenes xylosoxydans xylosoxydans TaxID=85698 RepID=UPI000A84207F|nr:hypothetical protein [Achromobacter xylosoxidans]